MRIALVSTYELGHQPLHLARPAAVLAEAGHEVRCLDLSLQPWDHELVAWAEGVAFSVPMHTAMRLALGAAEEWQAERPGTPTCLYGLYAPMSVRAGRPASLQDAVALAGEYEPALAAWVAGLRGPPQPPVGGCSALTISMGQALPVLPARRLLPPLDRYAHFVSAAGERLVACVEATHGCSHRCRHCPIPVIYDGRVRRVDVDAVLTDIEQAVDLGARHITFGDPDFLNTPRHAERVVSEMHERHPELSFDITAKVEHILRYPDLWDDLARFGCAFVVSAVESVNDTILRYLDKGHTAGDASAAVCLLRAHGIEMRPSWLPFTPWTTLRDVADILDFVVAHDLVPNVDPVQYTIRLLVPDGSLLLETSALTPALTPALRGYDAERLSWTWEPVAPEVDILQARLASVVEQAVVDGLGTRDAFALVEAEVRAVVPHRSAVTAGGCSVGPVGERPHLTEPWFCCSEPTQSQRAQCLSTS